MAPQPTAPAYPAYPDTIRHAPAPRRAPPAYRLDADLGAIRPRPRKARVRRLRFGHRAAMLAAALAGGLLFVTMTEGGRNARHAEPALPELERLADAIGLGIDQVSVTGHRFTPDGDIFDALQLGQNRLLPGFDSAAAQRRIEALPWVRSAELTRVLPGRIDVRITEREAFASWNRGDDEVLIDLGGRVLQRVPKGSVANLPRVAGEGAGPEAIGLLALLSRYPALMANLDEARRVGGRRWRIALKNGSRIELPPDGEALVLDALASDGALEGLVAGAPRSVDLRAAGRIAVQPAEQSGRRLAGVGAAP